MVYPVLLFIIVVLCNFIIIFCWGGGGGGITCSDQDTCIFKHTQSLYMYTHTHTDRPNIALQYNYLSLLRPAGLTTISMLRCLQSTSTSKRRLSLRSGMAWSSLRTVRIAIVQGLGGLKILLSAQDSRTLATNGTT